MDNEFAELEDRLKQLRPRPISTVLRKKCLAALADDSREHRGPIGKIIWIGYLKTMAACTMLALTIWSGYENYQLRRFVPPTRVANRQSTARICWRHANASINTAVVNDTTGTCKILIDKSANYWRQRQDMFR